MAIELHGTVGAIIFFLILIFLQIFFGVIGGLFCSYIGLSGLYWWIITIGIVLIGDMIFVNIS